MRYWIVLDRTKEEGAKNRRGRFFWCLTNGSSNELINNGATRREEDMRLFLAVLTIAVFAGAFFIAFGGV
ncbi:hypothetical protein COU17_03270 [Candidatus Kaiserbacteria bacterium CG10_big_fil_rev_8_21_14_0_10_49_17]|uniref:Uncharacterized protein n=1 Tax=Candidatus Kaiserbacteria bacterium CG10_big_fil_rev_8_21_14_0_10_49_17 TaxID=1974609 RepID=A0A2M6WDT6_9BACT|nr:MAG: hypothetical protein COU17_03270 [Candidatus Kaiserbacteria bacterium CG10_big_fil_rev_8_21_14_0_10_49_17]